MACEQRKYLGKVCTIEYNLTLCGDTLPTEDDWKAIVGFRSKSVNTEWETVDSTADDTKGFSRENLSTYIAGTIEGDGVLINDNSEAAKNLRELAMFQASPVAKGGQPHAWIRLTMPDLTYVAYMNITNMSREMPNDDVCTFTFGTSSAPSPFGFMVTETPSIDQLPTAVEISPDTPASIAVDETVQLTVVVTPAGASQDVKWSVEPSSAAFIKVDQSGLVTGLATGSGVVVASSRLKPSVLDYVTVTVS